MINTLTRTYKAVGNGNTSYVNRVKVEINYQKGGHNFFYGGYEDRGYYFSISGYGLIDHGGGLYSRELHIGKGAQGVKYCIVPCERQSKKRYELAKSQIDELTDAYLGRWLAENGIVLESLDYEEDERDRNAR